MNTNNLIEAKRWDTLVKKLSSLSTEGINLKCPFCGEKGVSSIGGGIVELKCYTRIAIESKANGKNVVTQNGHAIGTIDERYPYKEYECRG